MGFLFARRHLMVFRRAFVVPFLLLAPVFTLVGCDSGPSEPRLPDAHSFGEPLGLPAILFGRDTVQVQVAIRDEGGVVIPGAPFTSEGTGIVSPRVGVADANGMARLVWSPGTAIATAEILLTSGEAWTRIRRTVEVEEVTGLELTAEGSELGVGEPRQIEGRVLNQRDGGMPGVEVRVGWGEEETPLESGSNGRFGPLTVTAPEEPVTVELFVEAGSVKTAIQIPIVAGPAARLDLLSPLDPGGALDLAVGLEERVSLQVLDRFMNPVSGVLVESEVTAGTLLPGTGESDADGIVELGVWTLPQEEGEAVLRLSASGIEGEWTGAVHEGPEIASLHLVEGTDPYGVPGGRVALVTVIEARDSEGSPLPGALLDVEVEAGSFVGSGAPVARLRADERGLVTLPDWRLGKEGEEDRIRIRSVRGSGVVEVVARAKVGDLTLRRVAGNRQIADAGERLPDPIQIRVEDPHGRPVWDVPAQFLGQGVGDGLFEPAEVLSGRDGTVETEWTLGSVAGERRARAEIVGGRDILLEATARAIYLWTLDGVAIGQAVQDLEGSVPLIEGKAAAIRAFARWTPRAPEGKMPDRIEAEIYHGDLLVAQIPLSRPEDTRYASEDLLEWEEGMIARGGIPANLVQPGLGVRLRIDPEGVETGPAERDVWPRDGMRLVPVEVHPSPIRIRLIPIEVVGTEYRGKVEGREEEFTGRLRDMMDRSTLDVEIAPPFLWSGDPVWMTDGQSWIEVLVAVREARRASGDDGRFWYGVVDPADSIGARGVAGMGYVGYPAALGWDRHGAGRVLAHELGHNMGRLHAPCGSPTGVDLDFPVPGGRTGAWGYDAGQGISFGPQAGDIMSYCYAWISAYTRLGFEDGLRTLFPNWGQPAATASEPAFRMWGYRAGEEWVLEPGYLLDRGDIPTEPAGRQMLQVVGTDQAGMELFRVGTFLDSISHVDGGSFGASVPVSRTRGLHRLELVDERGVVHASRERASEGSRVLALEDGDLRWTAGQEGLAIRRADDGTVIGIHTGPVIPDGSGRLEIHDGFGAMVILESGHRAAPGTEIRIPMR